MGTQRMRLDRRRIQEVVPALNRKETPPMSSQSQKHEIIFAQIVEERARQEQLREIGRFDHTCASLALSEERKLAIVAEEIGEMAKEVTEIGFTFDRLRRTGDETWKQAIRHHQTNLRKELIQSAAVLVAWLEAIQDEAEMEQ